MIIDSRNRWSPLGVNPYFSFAHTTCRYAGTNTEDSVVKLQVHRSSVLQNVCSKLRSKEAPEVGFRTRDLRVVRSYWMRCCETMWCVHCVGKQDSLWSMYPTGRASIMYYKPHPWKTFQCSFQPVECLRINRPKFYAVVTPERLTQTNTPSYSLIFGNDVSHWDWAELEHHNVCVSQPACVILNYFTIELFIPMNTSHQSPIFCMFDHGVFSL